MKSSSNNNMEQVFEHLAKIKKVEPSIYLHNKTFSRFKKQTIIPLFWVRAAACLLIVYTVVEVYFASNKLNNYKQDISILIPTTNNILYNE